METEALAKELDREIEAINIFVQAILKKNDIPFSKLTELLMEKREKKTIIKVPCCIFKERSLGILESLTIYLKENLNLSYSDIASLLNRNHSPIWMTYNNAKKKFNSKLTEDKQTLWIPISIFSERKFGLL